MNNAEDRNGQSIDELARSIVNNDPSNAAGRPGKKGSTGRFFRKPLIWVAGAVLVAAIVGIVLSLGHGSSPGGATEHGFVGYVCHGTQLTLFDNVNADAVSNGGSRPTFSTHGNAYCLMYVQTYHWNNGAGSTPGTIGLVRLSGPGAIPSYVASLPAKTSAGENGAANVNWFASVPITKPVILDGEYSCADSDPSTWSTNKESGGAGFCLVYADLAIPPHK